MKPQERVQEALRRLGIDSRVVEYEGSTGTAAEAAAAVGCEPGQIVKTLFFLAHGRPTLALVAGDQQVDTALLASLLGVARKRLRMGTAEEVEGHTGYAIGGVAPVGLARDCDVVVDSSLRRFAEVWAAAGTTHAVFGVPTDTLAAAVNGQWAAITRGQGQ